MGESRLGFGLLGPLLVTVADTPVALGTPKQRAVLAMLLINRNRAGGNRVAGRRGLGSVASAGGTRKHSFLRFQPAPDPG